MAEPVKAAATAKTPPPPPPPVETVPEPVEPPAPPTKFELALKKFGKTLSGFLTTTTWFVIGLGFIALGFLEHQYRFSHSLPEFFKLMLHNLHLPYLFVGIGLLCLGKARYMIYADYAKEVKKNKKSPLAWRLPLIATQIAILYLAAIFYFLPVGFGWVPPIQNMLVAIFGLFIFLLYALWYVIAHMQHHFPSIAGLRVAMFVALPLAFSAFLSWSYLQSILPSLFLGAFALIAAIASLVIAPAGSAEQRGNWLRMTCLVASGVLVWWVGYNALPFGKPRVELTDLGLAVGDPKGEIGLLSYAPPIYHSNLSARLKGEVEQKIAFSLKTKEGWFLQVVNSLTDKSAFKVAAGEGAFRPIFIEGGRSLIIDAVENGARGLWKINAETGLATVLKKSGVQPFGDGVPWHESNQQFLFVTQGESGYRLSSWSSVTGGFKILLDSETPILTPSFTFSGREVVYTDGASGLFRILNLKTSTTEFLTSSEEKSIRYTGEGFAISEVIPAPDGFRYLYTAQTGGKTALWTVLADGSKRKKIYNVSGTLSNLSWHPDGQKIVFEEQRHLLGYFKPAANIRILDANLGTVLDLIPEQISHKSPAVSPDGVKIAFVGSQGLWLPGDPGIWVAFLR